MSRLPRAFPLPFGYEVIVVRGECGDAWGLWDRDTRTITLDPAHKSLAELRHTFLHEAEHAFKDWLRWVRSTQAVVNPDGSSEEPDPDGSDE